MKVQISNDPTKKKLKRKGKIAKLMDTKLGVIIVEKLGTHHHIMPCYESYGSKWFKDVCA